MVCILCVDYEWIVTRYLQYYWVNEKCIDYALHISYHFIVCYNVESREEENTNGTESFYFYNNNN